MRLRDTIPDFVTTPSKVTLHSSNKKTDGEKEEIFCFPPETELEPTRGRWNGSMLHCCLRSDGPRAVTSTGATATCRARRRSTPGAGTPGVHLLVSSSLLPKPGSIFSPEMGAISNFPKGFPRGHGAGLSRSSWCRHMCS